MLAFLLQAIFTKFRANVGGKLPSDFFTWLEILLGGESDLLMCNPASGYNYGGYFEQALLAAFGGDQDDVDKAGGAGVRGLFGLLFDDLVHQ